MRHKKKNQSTEHNHKTALQKLVSLKAGGWESWGGRGSDDAQVGDSEYILGEYSVRGPSNGQDLSGW